MWKADAVGIIVAIDGPAGSGKSTLARGLALALEVAYVNTGLMYRALAARALERGVDPDDGSGLLALLSTLTFDLDRSSRPPELSIDGAPPEPALTSADVERVVSRVARHQDVRAAMRDAQRALGGRHGQVHIDRIAARDRVELPAVWVIFALFAGGDFGLRYFQNRKRLRMSKQDIREEVKEQEGDPHIKARIDRIRRERRRKAQHSLKDADVVLENFGPGTMERLGCGFADLSALNPKLIMTSITPFGRSGPRSTEQATDLTLLAGGGLKTGQMIGATDRHGGEASERPVHIGEVFSTLYQRLGIDTQATTLTDLAGRPQYLVDSGIEPIHELVG